MLHPPKRCEVLGSTSVEMPARQLESREEIRCRQAIWVLCPQTHHPMAAEREERARSAPRFQGWPEQKAGRQHDCFAVSRIIYRHMCWGLNRTRRISRGKEEKVRTGLTSGEQLWGEEGALILHVFQDV